MPRMSKKDKKEWDFYLDDNGRISCNELCRSCDRECKQSFRAVIISCPEYNSNHNTSRQIAGQMDEKTTLNNYYFDRSDEVEKYNNFVRALA